jgi:hypothetical protein
LEFYGGFHALTYNKDAQFPSSLAPNGTVRWGLMPVDSIAADGLGANVSLSIAFPNVDFAFLQKVYGWAATQYQGWARGEVQVSGNEMQTVILHTDRLLEYWIDDTHYYGGDFYSYRRAPPVLHLEPGTHTIDIHFIRDVRAMGGVTEPTIDIVLDLKTCSSTTEVVGNGILVSDVINDTFAGKYASVTLRNPRRQPVIVQNIVSSEVSNTYSEFPHFPCLILPGLNIWF